MPNQNKFIAFNFLLILTNFSFKRQILLYGGIANEVVFCSDIWINALTQIRTNLTNYSVLICYTTSFPIYHLIYDKPPHFRYTTSFPIYHLISDIPPQDTKYGLYSPKFFRPQIKNWYTIKIFSLPTHPHSNHFSYKYQNFQHFYFTYMVHKPHTFQVLAKLVYGL